MQACEDGLLVVLPRGWDRRPEEGPSSVLRGDRESSAEAVRAALQRGVRRFLIGADGVARRRGWLIATDHVAFFGDSPLVGPERDDLGPRFPSLTRLYAAPEGPWRRGTVGRVPDWRASTRAELGAMRVSALVSEGIDEAIVAGRGGGTVLLLVRCHSLTAWNGTSPPIEEALRAFAGGEKT